MNVGIKIQNLLDEHNMSRQELGDELGKVLDRKSFGAKSVGNWIIERNEPSLEIINAMCKIFNISSAYFFDEEVETNEALLDKIIKDFIDEKIISKDIKLADISVMKQQLLLAALEDHIHKIIDEKKD